MANNRVKPLPPLKRESVIDALIDNPTLTAAAKALETSRVSLWWWLKQEPEIRAEALRRRRALTDNDFRNGISRLARIIDSEKSRDADAIAAVRLLAQIRGEALTPDVHVSATAIAGAAAAPAQAWQPERDAATWRVVNRGVFEILEGGATPPTAEEVTAENLYLYQAAEYIERERERKRLDGNPHYNADAEIAAQAAAAAGGFIDKPIEAMSNEELSDVIRRAGPGVKSA